MIKLEHGLAGSCMSCGYKSDYEINKITAESDGSGLKWSLALCDGCLRELIKQTGVKETMPRKFKCSVGSQDSCNTCKHEYLDASNEICKECYKAVCPLHQLEGSCSGCKWEAK